MKFSFFKNPLFLFLFKLLGLYIAWYIVYELWLHPNETIDVIVVKQTLGFSKKILECLGYDIFTNGNRMLGINNTSGLMMGDNCNGIALFALFSAFIIAFPGPVRKKIIFIILGIISIQLLNVMRVVTLAIIETYSYQLTQFNHTYTFTVIIYGYIFLLWILWVNKFSGTTPKPGRRTPIAHF